MYHHTILILSMLVAFGSAAAIARLVEPAPPPRELDWRKVPNMVSKVKDQGDCQSGYAFATAGLLEGQQVSNSITRKLIELSAQNVIDCTKHNYGCEGGSVATALEDLYELGGIETARSYPQANLRGACKFNRTRTVMRPLNFQQLPSGHEEIAKQIVANYGPVAVEIQATENLKNYKSGVFSDSNCTGTTINHSALIVGYGESPQEGDYWLIKNSWGEKWGEKGYFRMKRGVNMCSVALYPTISLFGTM